MTIDIITISRYEGIDITTNVNTLLMVFPHTLLMCEKQAVKPIPTERNIINPLLIRKLAHFTINKNHDKIIKCAIFLLKAYGFTKSLWPRVLYGYAVEHSRP